jgi:hypothetical protein
LRQCRSAPLAKAYSGFSEMLWFNSRAIELPFSSCANLQQRTIL